MQEPNVEAFNHANSNHSTTSVSSSSSIDCIGGSMGIKPSVNTSLDTRSQDHGSVDRVADADVSSIRNGMASLNMSDFPTLESENFHAGHLPQTVPLPQTSVGPNQFLQIPANVSPVLQPILPSLGFIPPQYAANPAGFLTSQTPVYPYMIAPGYLPQQYAIGGYAFNPPPVSLVATGNIPNPFPTPTRNLVPSFSGQSQTSGVNMQQVYNLYGHFGLPFSWDEHMLRSLGAVNHNDLNSSRLDTANPYVMQTPNQTFTSPSLPESPIGGVSYLGARNESVSGGWNRKTNPLLEELKTSKGRRLRLSEVYGHIFEFSVDQYGSRFIQQKLEVCSNEQREAILKELLPHASKLINDVFGNYVIQKILDYGNAEHRRVIGNLFEGQIFPLSLQMYGCRVIQKALEVFDLEQKIKILHELEGHILKCVCDQNGNHVIQKCIENLPTENIKTIISTFHGQVASLAKHPYGCRVVKRVLEHSRDRLQSQFIVDEILNVAYDLAKDQFGNYVIQYLLEVGEPTERRHIINELAGHMVWLCQDKYASNVVEKCLVYGDEAAKKVIIEEIIGISGGNNNFLVMVKDPYANYVVQKILEICNDHQREVLLSRLRVHFDTLKKYTYGKHIVSRFEKWYSEESQASGSNSVSLSDGNLYSSGQSV